MPYTPPHYSAPANMDALVEARERAIALLTDRYADDSMSEAEFEARLQWLASADSPARVEALVADLSAPRAPATVEHGRTGSVAAEERLLAIMSSSSRVGRWTMPQRLVVRAVMSEVTLDLRDAWLPPFGEIDLLVVMANVHIIVPPEVCVECGISAVMGTVRNDAGDWPTAGYSAPRLLLAGSCVMAEVRVEVVPRLR